MKNEKLSAYMSYALHAIILLSLFFGYFYTSEDVLRVAMFFVWAVIIMISMSYIFASEEDINNAIRRESKYRIRVLTTIFTFIEIILMVLIGNIISSSIYTLLFLIGYGKRVALEKKESKKC